MKIFECKKITEEFASAFKRLIPQLDQKANIPSKDYLEQLVKSNSTFLFLAEEKEIVGTLTLIINQMPSGQKAWIEDVVVDEKARGKGVGRKLIEAAISFSKKKGIPKIDLTSRPERMAANNLYQKLGFVKRKTNVYRLDLNG
jgi:ribosomal protein S18 acetylase RimI-like enzyme